MAAEKGRLEIVRDLLERKADPTHRDAGENTPLHFAAQVLYCAGVPPTQKFGAHALLVAG